jgi:hypothetical protein
MEARRRSVARWRRRQLLGEEEGEVGFWFFTFSEARDVNLEDANAEVACWAGWADFGWKREETWVEMDKPNRNKYFEYLAVDLTKFK